MGYDLYGMDPVVHKSITEYPVLEKFQDMDWKEKNEVFDLDEKLKKTYWEEYEAKQDENAGDYFRANVWWWRRLWNYSCEICKDILDKEDIKGGDSNSGYEITAAKATTMAKLLQESIDDGIAAEYEEYVKDYIKNVTRDKHGHPKSDEDWYANYPFEVSFLRRFITFCSESGGFQIS